MAEKDFKKLRKLQRMAFGGALVGESVGVMRDARNPAALSGRAAGFLNIGVMGKIGDVAFDLVEGKKRKRR